MSFIIVQFDLCASDNDLCASDNDLFLVPDTKAHLLIIFA